MNTAQRRALAELAQQVIQGDNLQIGTYDTNEAGMQITGKYFDAQVMAAAGRLCERLNMHMELHGWHDGRAVIDFFDPAHPEGITDPGAEPTAEEVAAALADLQQRYSQTPILQLAARLCEVYAAECNKQEYSEMYSLSDGTNMNCGPSRHVFEEDEVKIHGLLTYLELPNGKTGAVTLCLDVRDLGQH